MTDAYDNLEEYAWLMDQVLLHEESQAIALGNLLSDKLHPESVIDIGCGPGIYLVSFKERGARILGIDGCPPPDGGKSILPSEFRVIDLREDWTPPELFDLGLNIEVAEHIKPEYADNLVQIIAKSCKALFFSAAHPGQSGEGHYNEQPISYWMEKFSKYGFVTHPLNGEIMSVIKSDPVYEVERTQWLRANGILLGKV